MSQIDLFDPQCFIFILVAIMKYGYQINDNFDARKNGTAPRGFC